MCDVAKWRTENEVKVDRDSQGGHTSTHTLEYEPPSQPDLTDIPTIKRNFTYILL